MAVQNVKERIVYKKAYEQALNFFDVSKLTDCDGENSETDTCWNFARDCGYISTEAHTKATDLSHKVSKMLGSMIKNPKNS
jgi:four helix bundle protein